MKREKKKKKRRTEKQEKFIGMKKENGVLLVSGIFAFFLLSMGLIFVPQRFQGIIIGAAVLIGFIPYSFLSYVKKKKVTAIEERFPDFIRDIAASRKSGMTLPQAIYKSSKTDYGKLSPEIKKMANQISWGIPFRTVLQRFSDRVDSKFIKRSVAIILEAEISGGSLADTLDSVAKDAHLIKEAERERKSKLNQQTMIMYAIFLLFVAIVVALQRLMIPLLSARGLSVSAQDPESLLNFYKNLFFSMIMLQAIFNGLLAGQISEGSAVLGLKHSAVFLTIGVVVSWIFIL
ncbi:MAG: type II secretion system F family protein [Candidatus Undinarchaeales archaeon]